MEDREMARVSDQFKWNPGRRNDDDRRRRNDDCDNNRRDGRGRR
jgi:hypothetical protein